MGVVSKGRQAAGCGCLLAIGVVLLLIVAASQGPRVAEKPRENNFPAIDLNQNPAGNAEGDAGKAEPVKGADGVAMPAPQVPAPDPEELANKARMEREQRAKEAAIAERAMVINLDRKRKELVSALLFESGLNELKDAIEAMPAGPVREGMAEGYNIRLVVERVRCLKAAEVALSDASVSNGDGRIDWQWVNEELARYESEDQEKLQLRRAEANRRAEEFAARQKELSERKTPEEEAAALKRRLNGRLILAQQYLRINQRQDAKAIFEKLVKEHGDTEAGKEAAKELEKLR
jgi:hypothetical protein